MTARTSPIGMGGFNSMVDLFSYTGDGFYKPDVVGAISRSVESRLGGMLSVKDFGAVGDDSTDDSAAFQAAITSGKEIYVPGGDYRFEHPLLFPVTTNVTLIGDASAMPKLIRRFSSDDYPEDRPLMHIEETYLTFENIFVPTNGASEVFLDVIGEPIRLENLEIWAGQANPKSQAMQIYSRHRCRVQNCYFVFSWRGLIIGRNCFDPHVEQCRFDGVIGRHYDLLDPAVQQQIKNATALSMSGHSSTKNITVMGSGTAVQLWGSASTFGMARLENPFYGIRLGGTTFLPPASNGTAEGEVWRKAYGWDISAVSIEGAYEGLQIDNSRNTTLSAINVQGKGVAQGSRPWLARSAIVIKETSDVETTNCSFTGLFTEAVVVYKRSDMIVQNSGVTNGDGRATIGGPSLINHEHRFVGARVLGNMSQPKRTSFSDLMLRGLTNLRAYSDNASNELPLAKNLGGSNAVSSGASSVDVRFPEGITDIRLSGVNAVDDAASTLEPGTYYYAMTVLVGGYVGGVMPTDISDRQIREVTVLAGQKVDVNWFNRDAAEGRRIWRGKPDGTWEGYWDVDENSSLQDDGSIPFDGTEGPLLDNSGMSSRVEDDANYQIVATPSWHTTVIVTNKTMTGFTVEFGTPAPDDQQSVAWLLFRP